MSQWSLFDGAACIDDTMRARCRRHQVLVRIQAPSLTHAEVPGPPAVVSRF